MPKKLTPRGQAAPPVEPINTGATLPPNTPTKYPGQRPKSTESGIMYVRNLHHIKTIVRLTSKREIALEPRGQREDLDIVSADEQEDPKFLANVDLLFEVIEPEVAKGIISKQRTNARTQQHSLWDHLRTEDGKKYTQTSVTVGETFEQQGIVVATVEEVPSGSPHISKSTQVRRAGPEQTSVPGSPGHPATDYMLSDVPSEIRPEEYREFLQWKAFKDAMEADKG